MILFKSIEAVAKAISANGKEFQGRELKIKKVEDLKQASMDKTRIFIGGLSMSTNKTTIKKFFKDCGDIKGINIISGNAKKPHGHAFIEFSNPEGATKAVELDGKKLDGEKVKVSIAKENIKKNEGKGIKSHNIKKEHRTGHIGKKQHGAKKAKVE